MRVEEIWRYPVKSLQGERLDSCEISDDGVVGDRGWALFDRSTGMGLTARRVPELLLASASLGADGGVRITAPDGSEVFVSVRLPGRDLRLKVWRVEVGRVSVLLLDAEELMEPCAASS